MGITNLKLNQYDRDLNNTFRFTHSTKTTTFVILFLLPYLSLRALTIYRLPLPQLEEIQPLNYCWTLRKLNPIWNQKRMLNLTKNTNFFYTNNLTDNVKTIAASRKWLMHLYALRFNFVKSNCWLPHRSLNFTDF